MKIEEISAIGQIFPEDRSECTCGHTGDQTIAALKPSGHRGVTGHGKCKTCNCEKFTWIGFTQSFKDAIK